MKIRIITAVIVLLLAAILFQLTVVSELMEDKTPEETLAASLFEIPDVMSEREQLRLAALCAVVCRDEPYLCKVCYCSVMINRMNAQEVKMEKILEKEEKTVQNREVTEEEIKLSNRAVIAALSNGDPTSGATEYAFDTEKTDFTVTFCAGRMFFGK